MPDLLTHYAVSFLIAKSRLNVKRALVLALVGLLPDLDVLLGIHRWVTHSLLVVFIATLPLLLLIYYASKEYLQLVLTALLVYILHLVLDLFTGATPILWPLIDSVWVRIGVNGASTSAGITISPSIAVITKTPDFTQREVIEGPVISETGVMLAVVVVTIILLDYLKSKHHTQLLHTTSYSQR